VEWNENPELRWNAGDLPQLMMSALKTDNTIREPDADSDTMVTRNEAKASSGHDPKNTGRNRDS